MDRRSKTIASPMRKTRTGKKKRRIVTSKRRNLTQLRNKS